VLKRTMTARVLCEREKSTDYVEKKICNKGPLSELTQTSSLEFNLATVFPQKDQIYCFSSYFVNLIHQLWPLWICSIEWKIQIDLINKYLHSESSKNPIWDLLNMSFTEALYCRLCLMWQRKETKDLCICSLPPQQFHLAIMSCSRKSIATDL